MCFWKDFNKLCNNFIMMVGFELPQIQALFLRWKSSSQSCLPFCASAFVALHGTRLFNNEVACLPIHGRIEFRIVTNELNKGNVIFA